MPECPRLAQCPFFNSKLKNMPAIVDMAKAEYCRSGKHETCARYLVARVLGSDGVPENLFPDQADRASAILRNK
jgi:hypothetical protein